MLKVNSVAKLNTYQPNITFKSDNTRYASKNTQLAPYESAVIQDDFDRIKKEQKKQKMKNNIMMGLSALASIGIIAICGMTLFGKARGGQAINTSKLVFEDLSKDKSLPDLATAKSIDEGVRKRMMELLEADEIPKDLKDWIGLDIPLKAMALLGNSGVGKTFMTRVYAKAIKADYLLTKFTDITSIYVGEAAKNVEALGNAIFDRAKKNPNKPIVWLIDEADTLMKPLNSSSNDTAEQIRGAMLKMLEEANFYPNLKIFIATNQKAELLDSAVLRRLGKIYKIPMPNEEVLMESLKFQLRNSKKMLKVDGFDFYKDQEKEIAEFIKNVYEQGGAHGDIETIVKSAFVKCAMEAKKKGIPTNKVKFDVKYLNEALAEKGKMAGAIEEERQMLCGF